ncbi:MAG: tagaturonate reductase [Anaerolineae bacterium]
MLPPLNRHTARLEVRFPERIIQFGGGNFLRGFVDWIVEHLNAQTDFAGSVVIVKPTPHGTYDALDAQDGLFHVRLTKAEAGQPVTQTSLITCVSRTVNPYQDYDAYLQLAHQPAIRYIISNTTESGIAFDPTVRFEDQPSESFPAKLTAFLLERFQHFHGDMAYGCVVLPCELIEQNGDRLKAIVLQYADLWRLPSGFAEWLNSGCMFCNTLVDRIVSGFPQDESAAIFQSLGFEDRMLVQGEWYHSWVIEAPTQLASELPFHRTPLNVKIVDDVRPYHTLKVRLLNGAHTSMVAPGLFLGCSTVRQAIEHHALGPFIRALVFDEIVPTLNMPDAHTFAAAVLDRFQNPYIDHRLAAIAQNSLSKIRTRLLPTLLIYGQQGKIPTRIAFVAAAWIRFYAGEWQGQPLPISDESEQAVWLRQLWASGNTPRDIARQVLSNRGLWGTDLTILPGLADRIGSHLETLTPETIENVLLG